MRRKMIIPVLAGMVLSLSLIGCSEKTSETQKVDATQIFEVSDTPDSSAKDNEEATEDDFYDDDYELNFDDCKNSTEGRENNFVFFHDEETANEIKTLKIIIYRDEDVVLEEFEIQNPKEDDYYCIAPVLNQNGEIIESYYVEFIVNDTYSWIRYFDSDPDNENGPRQNVISKYEDEKGIGFGSVLAG